MLGAGDDDLPASGRSMPAIRFSSVDLPVPLAPISETNSPSSNVQRHAVQRRDDRVALLVGLGHLADFH